MNLRPCPFCGKTLALEVSTAHNIQLAEHCDYCDCDEFEDGCAYITVVCGTHKGGCGASGGYYCTEEKAVRHWNGRWNG